MLAAPRELGEHPPEQWKNAELKVRCVELEEEKGIGSTRRTRQQGTELMTWVGVLHFGLGTDHQRSKDHGDLAETCHGEDLCHFPALWSPLFISEKKPFPVHLMRLEVSSQAH